MVKTGIVSAAYFGIEDFESGLRKMRSHGYDCTDYQGLCSPHSVLYTYSEAELERYLTELGQCAKETGIEISQMHGLWPTIDDTTADGRAKNTEYFLKDVRAANYMGCRKLVIHPCMPYGWGEEASREEAFDRTLETLEALLPTAKKEDVILCVENMPFGKRHSFSEITELKKLISTVNDENVKACFDTGHSSVTGENIFESVVTLGSDIAALHVHDDRYRQDRHLIPFLGDIDWSGFVKGLQKIGYRGCISLETAISQNMPEPMREQMQIALAGIARWFVCRINERKEEKP